jgi:hypothetical protein
MGRIAIVVLSKMNTNVGLHALRTDRADHSRRTPPVNEPPGVQQASPNSSFGYRLPIVEASNRQYYTLKLARSQV